MPDVLTARVKDLGLTLEGSRFAPAITKVRAELRATGIVLEPRFYLSNEYGCIMRTATIGLLWTDGFAFAQRLAKKYGVRTRTARKLTAVLRHEVGHAFCYTHRLYQSGVFRRTFAVRGGFFASYPDVWKPSAADEARVRGGEVVHLYATRHADEDFAVCFEVWLGCMAEGRSWQRRFAGRPRLLEKLAYVEAVVRERGGTRVTQRATALDVPVESIADSVHDWLTKVIHGTNYNLLPGYPVASA